MAPYLFFGIDFSERSKQNLLMKSNMGLKNLKKIRNNLSHIWLKAHL